VRRCTWTDDEVSTLVTMFKDGKTDKDIGKVLDRAPYGVGAKRREKGLKRLIPNDPFQVILQRQEKLREKMAEAS